jgi:hypothetical protein
VTLDGKPVDGATVVFVPTGTPAYGAYAITDSSGRFTLKSSETVTGAVPGGYLVQVTKLVPDTSGSAVVTPEEAEHEAQAKGSTPSRSEVRVVEVGHLWVNRNDRSQTKEGFPCRRSISFD